MRKQNSSHKALLSANPSPLITASGGPFDEEDKYLNNVIMIRGPAPSHNKAAIVFPVTQNTSALLSAREGESQGEGRLGVLLNTNNQRKVLSPTEDAAAIASPATMKITLNTFLMRNSHSGVPSSVWWG